MSNLDTALGHARLGYYVHPLVPRDKMPLAGGNGSNDGTRDEALIRAWWTATPDANIGISLDKTGLVDIAPDCPEWFERFKTNGMTRTTAYTSGGGAGHLHTLYRLPKGGPVARACVPQHYDVMSQGNAVAPGSIHPSGRAYKLLTPMLPVEDLPVAPQWALDMLAARVHADRNEHTPEEWAELPAGDWAANHPRTRALIKANQQLQDVVGGEGVTIAGDNSISAQRAVFVNQLIRARYPHDIIRALALHFQGVLESNPDYFKDDIDRLLFKYTPAGYQPEPMHSAATTPHGGRHYEITMAEMLDGYHLHADCGVNGIVLEWTQTESADHYGVSVGTIRRREADAIAAGYMRRVVSDDRQRSYIVLSVETWDVRSQRFDMPSEDKNDAYERTPAQAICSGAAQGTVSPPRDQGAGAVLPAQDGGWNDDPSLSGGNRPTADDLYADELHAGANVRSELTLAQQDALERGCEDLRNERAHVEITHSPILDPQPTEPDEWAGIDDEIDRWMQTTADGRHFAQLQAQYQHDLAGVERLRGVLSGRQPPQWGGACVPSTAPSVPSHTPPQYNAYRDIARFNMRKPNVNDRYRAETFLGDDDAND